MKSRQRIIDHGEVFTPPELVNDMLDLVAHECERIESRFLEPACGDGNFVSEVLRRKLLTVDARNKSNRVKWERDAVLAVCSIYGIDLLPDNVEICRQRLLQIVQDRYQERFSESLSAEAETAFSFILSRNIVQGDALNMRTSEDRPIVFSEWSPVNGTMLKRHDFAYDQLLNEAHIANLPLFSDSGNDVFLPTSVGAFPPCHYLKVHEAEQLDERT
ncbi:MAG: hypothetical protein JNL67_07780 [Planctomycetaceae bacterium]|nr:hypothetical protein [Planctomycetaceae bacterium]